jgi:hypothetical protein
MEGGEGRLRPGGAVVRAERSEDDVQPLAARTKYIAPVKRQKSKQVRR